MKSIPKFAATVVVFIIVVLVCISLIFAGLMMSNARTHHNNVIADIEASNFDADVINNCIQTANEKGYALTITREMNMSSTEHYRVALYYDLVLPLFGKVHTGKLVGYAYPGGTISGDLGGTADHYFEIDSNGVLGIKATYRWATGLDDYASDNGKDAAGSKNDLLPSEITIPTYWEGREVKALRNYMFAGDTALTKLTFEEGVQKVGDSAFLNCTNLDGTVVMANSVKTIGVSAFENCSSLDTLSFGSSSLLKTINNTAFKNCSSLNGSVAMPDTLKEIGVSSFENCSALDTVHFNATSKLEKINDYAFKNCSSFVNVALPDSMTSNGFGSFQGCVNMASYKAPFAGASPTGSKKSGGFIGHIFGSTSYSANKDFAPTTLTTVNLTKYVTDYACYKLDSLTSLTVGQDVVKMGDYSFGQCDGLVSVTIPKNVATTGIAVFYQCTNLTEAIFEEGSVLTTMGATNFCYCKKLEKVDIPNTVVSIGNYCFQDCDKLTFSTEATGKLHEGLTTLGTGVFKDCDGFETFTFPASVTTIESQILTNCSKNKYIQLASGNQSFCIGANNELLTIDKKEIVQYPCAGPETYTIPSTIITIRDNAFDRTKNLEEVYFDEATRLTTIGHGAFTHCDIENSIKLPASVTTIKNEAFYYGGSWNEIWIGPNVTSIGSYAFYGCTGIENHTYLLMEKVPTIGTEAFNAGNGSLKYYLFVKNQAMYDALVPDKHYNASRCVVSINGSLDYDVSIS